jgi:hypothetical protein
MSSRPASAKVLSRLSIAVLAALTLQCGGGDGGGVAPPTDPAIALQTSTVTFNGTAGGAAPAPQVINITNGGGGTLANLSTSVSYTAGQSTGWLTATLSATSAPSTLILTAAPGSLTPATYTALVAVAADGATNSPQTVTVTLTVAPSTGGGPLIALSSTTQNFAAPQGGANPTAQTVDVTNSGAGTLDGLTATVSYGAGQPTGWLNAALSAPAAPSTLNLTATTGSLTAGTYNASVAITSAAAANSPQAVAVTFTVAAPGSAPLIALSNTTISFTGTQGAPNPADQTIDVSNGGTGSLTGLAAAVTYGSGQPTDWLTATLDHAKAPATLTLAANTGALAPGTYNANVNVTSGVASNSPQAVAVTFTVSAPLPPTIVLSATTLDFRGVQSTDPPPATVDITNGVAGPLSGLSADVSYQAGQQTGWLFTTLSATDAPSTLTLTPMMASLGEGTYTATVNVSAPGATNTPQAITVTFTVATSGTPLLEYPFEGTVENTGLLAGFPNGTPQGTVTFPSDLNQMKYGYNSIKFGGGTSYVVLPGTAAVFSRTGNWTIGLWFMEEQLQANNFLFSNRAPAAPRGWETYHGVDPSLMFTCSDAGCVSFASPSAGAWHHLLYRYEAGSPTGAAPVDIYLDNELVGSIANAGGIPLLGEGVADIQVGAKGTIGSTFYVDELTVHDAVFTQQQQCVYVLFYDWTGTSCVPRQ